MPKRSTKTLDVAVKKTRTKKTESSHISSSSSVVENTPDFVSSSIETSVSLPFHRKDIIQPKRTKDVIWEKLYLACLLIEDEFWKTYFYDMSRGKNNKKIHINAKHVSHNSKKVSFNYEYELKTPEEIAVELRKIISNTMCIYSESDSILEKEEMNQIGAEFRDAKTEDDWKKVKNKKMRDHLITNYVLKLKKDFNLNWDKTKSAYNLIIHALYTIHTHKGDDFNMENGEIISIDDIKINADEIVNERFENLIIAEDDEPDKKKKISLDKEWVKLCKQMAKKSRAFLNIDASEDTLKASDKKRKKAKQVLEDLVEATKSSKEKEAEAKQKLLELNSEDVDAIITSSTDEIGVSNQQLDDKVIQYAQELMEIEEDNLDEESKYDEEDDNEQEEYEEDEEDIEIEDKDE